jgi:hypothetical protein
MVAAPIVSAATANRIVSDVFMAALLSFAATLTRICEEVLSKG